MLKKNNIEVIVVLDNIRSMHNIGSIFRTCDAMGNCSIYLCGICAIPPNKEIHKTALGASEVVKWQYFKTTEEALVKLRNQKFEIIAIEQTSKSIALHKFSSSAQKIALIFGNEVKGISQKIINLADKSIEINQYGVKKSMNVAVTTGITLWSIINNN
tara:strand:+ start:859 stop:1332 length:474 start_codon:yes stop_codon:yes gene_type:complete